MVGGNYARHHGATPLAPHFPLTSHVRHPPCNACSKDASTRDVAKGCLWTLGIMHDVMALHHSLHAAPLRMSSTTADDEEVWLGRAAVQAMFAGGGAQQPQHHPQHLQHLHQSAMLHAPPPQPHGGWHAGAGGAAGDSGGAGGGDGVGVSCMVGGSGGVGPGEDGMGGAAGVQHQSRDQSQALLLRGAQQLLQQVHRQQQQLQQPDLVLPHLMISYCWDSQSKALLLKEELVKLGFRVWMDVEKMSGSTLEAMALAVEQADAVLVRVGAGGAGS